MGWFLVRQDTHDTRFDVAQYVNEAEANEAMDSFEAGYPHHQTYFVERRATQIRAPRDEVAEQRSAEVLSQVIAQHGGKARGSAILNEVDARLGRPLEANVLMWWALERSSGIGVANSLVKTRYLRGDKHEIVDTVMETLLSREERT